MQLFADINTRKLVTSPTDKTPVGGLSVFAGNKIAVTLQFVDTSKGQVVNFDSQTLKVWLGTYQSPLIPVIVQATNTSGTPTVWKFQINLKVAAVKNAVAASGSLNEFLHIFITDGRYKTTGAMTPLAIFPTVIPYAVSSSSSSSSTSSGQELHAEGFGDTSYNGTYTPAGTHNGWTVYTNALGRLLYVSSDNGTYTLDTFFDDAQSDGQYQQNSAQFVATGSYVATQGTAPGGFVGVGELSSSSSSSSTKVSVSSSSSSTRISLSSSSSSTLVSLSSSSSSSSKSSSSSSRL